MEIPLAGPIQEHGFSADFRYDDRFAALDDTARDSFSKPVVSEPAGIAQAVRNFDSDFGRLCVQQSHRAPDHAVANLQDFQHLLEGDPRCQFAAQYVAGVSKHGKLLSSVRSIL